MQTRSRSITPHQRPNQSSSSASSRQVSSPTPSKTHFIASSSTPASSLRSSYQRKLHTPTTEPMAESSEYPASPTPKKGGQRSRRTPAKRVKAKRNDDEQRSDQIDSADQAEQEVDAPNEDMLFDLLGVTSPPVQESPNPPISSSTRGILNVSKADIEQAKPRSSHRKKNNVESSPELPDRRRDHSIDPNQAGVRSGTMERDVQSETDIKKRPQRKKGKGKGDQLDSFPSIGTSPAQPISALSASRPSTSAQPSQPVNHTPIKQLNDYEPHDAFETESLSQSLPTGTGKLFASPSLQQVQQGSKGKGKGKKGQGDESLVWEMPSLERPSTTQALTWQQQLQSSSSSQDSPRRSNKSTPKSGSSINSERKSRSRPASSTVHLNQIANGMASSPLVPRPGHTRRLSLDNVPISTFDHNQPFHTGMNVNRPPQTPAKLPGNMAPAAALPLLQGEFPRIGKVSNSGTPTAPMGASTPAGIKYAGPTFHNSPHAASLPKPDLDDF